MYQITMLTVSEASLGPGTIEVDVGDVQGVVDSIQMNRAMRGI